MSAAAPNHGFSSAVSARIIDGLPRIDRYFPQCWCAVVEVVSKLRFGIEDFGRVYGRHTFQYRKPSGPIAYRQNGVELDLEIHRVPLPEGELPARIEDIYGIRTDLVTFERFDAYSSFVSDSIEARVPVVTSFDLGFLKARREYGKVFTPHIIAVYGLEPKERAILVAEQMLGTTSVDDDDFVRCFEHQLARDGGASVWQLDRVKPSERDLDRHEVVARVEANVRNLASTDETLGLRGLSRFRNDLAEYLASDSFQGRPFSVPGLWVFSHERHIERKWLQAIRHLCPNDASGIFDEFDILLSKLFTRWLSADYLIEKSLLADSGRVLKALPSYLDEIVEDERRALEKWTEIHALIA